jgi:hypothetical protein
VMKEIEGQRDLVRRVLHMISWKGTHYSYVRRHGQIRMTAKPSPNLDDSQALAQSG